MGKFAKSFRDLDVYPEFVGFVRRHTWRSIAPTKRESGQDQRDRQDARPSACDRFAGLRRDKSAEERLRAKRLPILQIL